MKSTLFVETETKLYEFHVSFSERYVVVFEYSPDEEDTSGAKGSYSKAVCQYHVLVYFLNVSKRRLPFYSPLLVQDVS